MGSNPIWGSDFFRVLQNFLFQLECKYGRLIGAWVKFHQSEGSQASGLNHVEDFTPFGWHLGTQKTCSL